MKLTGDKSTRIILICILVTALFLRIFKLDSIPPAVSWDEAAVGYNAYAISNWGKDEWGRTLPLVFKSFEDDKRPIHVYLTAIPVRILGLSEFTTRLSPAIFGVGNVLLIFLLSRFLVKEKNKKNILGLVAALIMAVSPYTLQFSRFNHEATFALFFFMLGLWFFLKAIDGKPKFLISAFVSFAISILTYHSALVFVPLMIIVLSLFYFKELWKIKVYFLISAIALGVILSSIIFNPELLGTARIKQNALPSETIQGTDTYKKTGSEILSRLELSSKYYLSHFEIDYLFVSGDPIPRHSIQTVGEFYKIDAPLLLVGLVALLLKRSKLAAIFLIWALLAPIPASASPGANGKGHAARALFMMGSWHLIIAFGVYTLITLFRQKFLNFSLALILFVAYAVSFKIYIYDYYVNFPIEHSNEWQYGFERIAQYVGDHPEKSLVYVTDKRSQPYIFMLFYLKTPLPEFLETKTFNESHNRPSNLIASFGRYRFSYWDPIESMPDPSILYVVNPSDYDGLRHKNQFTVKRRIRNLNGNDAFFIVGYP